MGFLVLTAREMKESSFTCAIFRAVFDFCSSFFAPQPHRNAFYAGYCDANTGFPAKWRLKNKRRNSILMTRHEPDQGICSACDWLKHIFHAGWPIRSTTQIWVVTRHQYGISALVFRLTPVVALQNVGCLLCVQFGIGYSEKNRENFARNCFLAKEKEALMKM